jgi:hypothetical protein
MGRRLNPFLPLVFLLGPVISLWSQTIEPFVMPSARAGAMGGTHAAFTDDFYSIFTNPAAFVDVEEQFSAGELTVSMYGPVFEIIDLATKPVKSLDSVNISGLIGPKGFAAGFDVGGPLALGWVGRGVGLGVFNRIKTDASLTGTRLRPRIAAEIFLVGGYSFRFLSRESHLLDAGFLGKGFFRGLLNLSTSVFNAMDILIDPLNHQFDTHLGLGLDMGLRYTYAGTFSAALVCYDAYSPALVTPYASVTAFGNHEGSLSPGTYATVKPRLNLGVMYRLRSPFLERYISSLVFTADYRDFLDLLSPVPRNPVLNAGLGMELVLLNVLSLRAGITDALPAMGFGLDLAVLQFNCAIHGKELGFDPGVQPVYAIDLGLQFRY